MKVLLTGATGFIGTHTLRALAETGAEVTALVRDRAMLKTTAPRIETIEIDLARGDFDRVRGKWGVLIHLADIMPGRGGGSFSENCVISGNVAEKIIENSLVDKIVYASSIDVYGKPAYVPVDEKHPVRPLTYYAASKACNETVLSTASEINSIPLTVLRLSQVYGPGDPPIKAIPVFVERIKSGRPITIYGDGTDRRDYLYVKDAVSAVMSAVNSESTGTYNVATGKGHDLNEVVRTIEDLVGRGIDVRYEDRRKEKTEMTIDISKIKNSFGYVPDYDLRKGLFECLREEGCLTE